MRLPKTVSLIIVLLLVAVFAAFPGGAAVADPAAGSISGTVTDLSLQPIVGAAVRACSDWGQTHCTSTTTELDGTYVIDVAPGSYDVDVSVAGYMSEYYDDVQSVFDATVVEVLDGQDVGGIDFALGTAGWITGRITDAEGDGIGGATVQTGIWSPFWSTATTDANGYYALLGLPGADDYGVCATATGYAPECYDGVHNIFNSDPIAVVDGHETSGIDISLDVEGTISGIVTRAADGEPIEGAYVSASVSSGDGGWGSAYSAADGTYTIHGLAASSYSVDASADGYVDEYFDDVRDSDSAAAVAVTSGEDTPDIDFELDVGGMISGTVTDTDLNPLEGVNVEACLAPALDSCEYGNTGADGTYQITGLAGGNYAVRTSSDSYVDEYYNDKPSWDVAEADLVNVVEGEETQNIDFGLDAGGTISGIVTDSNGDPIENVQVEACLAPAFDFCEQDNTGADGTYQITGLAGGNYVVRTYSDDYADEYYNDKPSSGEADLVNVVEGEKTPNIDFTLGIPGTISGTVVDTDADPIEGAQVIACPQEGGDCGIAETAADGTYTITALDYLGYIVEASASGYVREYFQDARHGGDATLVVVSESNLNRTGIDFHLDIGGTISGTVTAGGNPVEGATVGVYDDPDNVFSNFHTATTDSSGNYAVSGVGTGSYLAMASKQGYSWEYYHEVRWEAQATAVSVTDNQNTPDIDFTLDVGGTICGTVEDANGDPIAGATVFVNPQDHDEPQWYSISQWWAGTFTDDTVGDGTYSIGDLAAGSYRVRASVRGYADKYYNAAYDPEDAAPVPVSEGHSSCSIDFVFGSDEPVPGPSPTPTATPQTRTPTPRPTHTRTPKPTATRTPWPTATPMSLSPSATPLPTLAAPAPSQPSGGALPSLAAPATGSGPADGGPPWAPSIWLLAAAGSAGVALGGYRQLVMRRRRWRAR